MVLPNCDSRGGACLFSLRDSSRTVACECFGAQRGLDLLTRLKIDAILGLSCYLLYCRIYFKYLKTFSNRVFENIRNLKYFQIFEISNVFKCFQIFEIWNVLKYSKFDIFSNIWNFKYFEMFWNIPNLKCFEIFEIWNVFKYLKFQIFSNILKYLKFRIFQNIWNFKYFQIADFKMFSNIWNRFYSINLAQNFSASKRSKRKRLKSL